MDEATKNFLKNAKPRKRTAQHPDIDPALAIYDLNHRSEPLEMHLPETNLPSQDHLTFYRELLQRNENSLASIRRLQRIVEGAEDGDALGLAIDIINDLSVYVNSTKPLVRAYQNSLK